MNTCKSAVRIAALAAAALALAGCAAPDARYEQSRQARADGVDYARMAAINHAARMKGVEVVWVNPPYRDGID